MLQVDVVVNGGEELRLVELQPVQDAVPDGLAIEGSVTLHNGHVMQIPVPVRACQIGQLEGDLCLAPAADAFIGQLLIILRHLQTQVPAAGVDHQIEIVLLVPVHLDEVVAAAQGADALRGAAGVDLPAAFQLGDVDLSAVAVGLLPHVSAVGNVLADEGVQGR